MGKKIIILLLTTLCTSCGGLFLKKKSIDKTKSEKLSNIDITESIKEIQLDTLYGFEYDHIVGSSVSSHIQSENLKLDPNVQKTEIKKEFGQIIYKIPDTMVVLKNYEIIIRISKGSNVNIEKNINGKITKSEIRVESRMEVKLKDPEDNFEISEINKERQLIEEDEFTEWRFGVKPKKTGKCKLNLVVSIIVGEDTKEIIYKDIITVRSNPAIQVKSWWEENWKTMLELILIPLFIWMYNKWKNRNK